MHGVRILIVPPNTCQAQFQEILIAIEAADGAVANVCIEQFMDDFRAQEAVRASCLAVAATAVELERYWKEFPELPWQAMAAFRTRVLMARPEVAAWVLWEILHREFPDIGARVELLLNKDDCN